MNDRGGPDMTDEELIARLRKYKDDLLSITADRIEQLVKDKRWIMEERDRTFALMLARSEAAEAQIAALTARVEGLTGAAKRVLAPLDEPCRHDHHGYCQTHFVEAECSVAALRAALSATTEEGK